MSYCPRCGLAQAEAARECPGCGVTLAGTGVPAAPPGPPPAPPPGPGLAPAAASLPPLAAPAREPAGAGYPPELRISHLTVSSLNRARPWLRFLGIYGLAAIGLMAVAGVGTLFSGLLNPRFLPLALVYGFYAAVGLALVLPLRRSVAALDAMATLGARGALEGFVTHQATFWRRAGILTVTVLSIVVLGLIIAAVLGGLAAVTT